MSKIGYFATFAVGAAVGSVASWYFLKTKYERIAQEEIDSVKEVFSKRNHVEPEKEEDDVPFTKNYDNMMDYAKKLDESGYTDYSTSSEAPKEKIGVAGEEPYVITPEEFGELEDYTEISMTYYADNILTDDLDELIEDIPGTVGFESLNHFGEYEDDSVFVRNDRLKCDYEILLDNRKYADVIKTLPPRFGGFYAEE